MRVSGPFTVESFSAFRFPNAEASRAEKIASEDESNYILAATEKLKFRQGSKIRANPNASNSRASNPSQTPSSPPSDTT